MKLENHYNENFELFKTCCNTDMKTCSTDQHKGACS